MKSAKTAFYCLLLLSVANTVNGATRFWIAGSSSNWNNSANWSISSGGPGGASVPAGPDAVVFDNLGIGNCNFDAAVNITSLTANPGYSGTLNQGVNIITISNAVSLSGGNFNGGSANITVTGTFTLSGAIFTATTGVLELRDNAAFTSGSFIHNNGTVRFNTTNTITQTTSGISPTFYVLEYVGISRSYTMASTGNVTVLNSLNISGASFYNLYTGTFDVKGDINITNTAAICGGDAQININGTGTQNFNGAASAGLGALPKLAVNKSSGTFNLFNFPSISNDFTYTAGTINAGSSTVCFSHGTAGSYTLTGNANLANITFTTNSSGQAITINPASTLSASGDLTIGGSGNLNLTSGNINVSGNIVLTNTAFGTGGTTTINILGLGNQSIDATTITAGQARLPNVIINKIGGTLSFLGNISFIGNVTYVAGTINPGTATIHFTSTLTVTGSFSVYNLSITSSGTTTITLAAGTTLSVTNDFTLANGAANNILINTGTIAVQGNIIDLNTAVAGGGSGTLLITGTGNQTISSTGVIYQGSFPAVTINKTGGTLTFPSLLTEKGNWTYIAGVLDVTTNNATVVFAATLTISGTETLQNAVFDGSAANTMTIAAGTTVGLSGDMTISGASNVNLNTGTINLQGNLVLTNTATGGGGSALINIMGSGNQVISGTLTKYQSSLPAVTINKSSGTLTFPLLVTIRGNWTYTSGTLDVTTNNSNIVFGNSLSISGTHTLNNVTFDDGAANYTYAIAASTVLSVNGNMTMSGTGNIFLNGGICNLYGNLLLSNTAVGGGGNTVLAFVASVDQNIISSLIINQCNLPAVTINKPAGVLTFPAIISVKGNWSFITGTMDVTSNNSTVVYNGTLSITGNQTLNNINFEGIATNTFTINTGTILSVSGTLTTSGSGSIFINTPVAAATGVKAQGNIAVTNTSAGGGGTATILINGITAQQLSSTSASGQGRLPYIKIQKASGTLTLAGIISESRDWTYASGTVSQGTSTVAFGGNNLTITSVGMSFYNISVLSNTITSGNSLTVTGSLAISGGALAPGANTINVGGNWSDYGTAGFTESSGTVNFNGAALQTIASPGGENFTNLIVSNSGAGIQLVNNIFIFTAITMTSGNMDLNGNAVTLGSSAVAPGTMNYTSGSMINTGVFTRWFAKSIISSGSSAGLFPVGTSSNYRPLSVSVPTVPTTGGTISLTYTDASTNTTTSFNDGAATVTVRKDLNWAMTTAGLAGGVYDLNVSGSGYGTVGNVADLRITLANSVTGSAGVNAGTTSNPQINRASLSQANLNNVFYIGSVNNIISPLPIILISFSAHAETNAVRLDWQTASEINNDHFTIQRSRMGGVWEDVQKIEASGQGSNGSSYVAYDQNPYRGNSYYRLEQTDLDGNHTFSSIRQVTLTTNTAIVIYPNPATDILFVAVASPKSLAVYSIDGKKLYVSAKVFSDKTILNISYLKAGVYFIQIDQNGQKVIKQFIKK